MAPIIKIVSVGRFLRGNVFLDLRVEDKKLEIAEVEAQHARRMEKLRGELLVLEDKLAQENNLTAKGQ